MRNKILAYVGIGFFVLILIGSLFVGLGMNGNSVKDVGSDVDFEKYRSEEIPVDCRLPDYDDNVEKWVEHLGHHENTWYCLDYYEEVEGGEKHED